MDGLDNKCIFAGNNDYEVMKYSQELITEMGQWVAENGLMEYGGAKLLDFLAHFCIDDVTYYNWMRKSEFSEIIKKAKAVFKSGLERDIVKSMAKSAKGYEYVQTSKEYKDGKEVKRTTKTVTVEPNVAAGIFLLTNLAPERWQNKQNMPSTSDDVVRIEVSGKDNAKAIQAVEAVLEKINESVYENNR